MDDNGIVQYFVEGEDEKKLINTLKTDMQLVYPGKVSVFNVVQKLFSNARLMNLRPDTTVVLVFDTDVENAEVLRKNVEILHDCKNVKKVIMIPQVKNLEQELVRACKMKNINELLGTKSVQGFKSEFIRISNLANKLKEKGFDINKLWVMDGTDEFGFIKNESGEIKI